MNVAVLSIAACCYITEGKQKMNKFNMAEVTQRLSKCNRNLDKSLQILSKSTGDAEEAFNNLSDALEKIKLANDYIKSELREVI